MFGISRARHGVATASLTLRNGLPRFVVFIMWDDPAGTPSAGIVATIQERKERTRKTKEEREEEEEGEGERWGTKGG